MQNGQTEKISNSTSALPKPVPLTDRQKQLIKSTVPLLAEHGAAITRRMYGAMLEDNPDLKNIFSHSKQMVGSACILLHATRAKFVLVS